MWQLNARVRALVAVMAALLFFLECQAAVVHGDHHVVRKQLHYRFLLENKAAVAIDQASFRVMVPVRQTSTQRVEDIRSNLPYKLVADEMGNQVLEFQFHELSAFNKSTVRIEVDIVMAGNPDANAVAEHAYLAAETFVPLSNSLVQTAGQQIKEEAYKNKVSLSRATYLWLTQNLSAVEYISEDRGAAWALENRQGDCTEFMYAFIALLRANGVQARGVSGYVVGDEPVTRLALGKYHNWAEYRDGDTWRISDPHQKIFDEGYSRYVAFHVFSDVGIQDVHHSQEFYSVDSRLSVRMI